MKKYFFLMVLPLFLFASPNKESNVNKEGWGKNLYIVGNFCDRDDRYLKLSDGSYWRLNFTYKSFGDRLASFDRESMWLAPDSIEIRRGTNHLFPYLLTNLENNEIVEARQIDPLLRIGSIMKRLELKSTTFIHKDNNNNNEQ
jgi:hypothetical protein